MLGVDPEPVTIKCFDMYANPMTLPAVSAVCNVTATRIPHVAVDVGNAMRFAFVPDVGLEPLGAGKFVVVFAYSTRLYAVPDVETSLNVGVVLNQNGDVVEATSCQVTVPSMTVPPGSTSFHEGSVLDVVPVVSATKILFVPVPGVVNVSNALGIKYWPLVIAIDADHT